MKNFKNILLILLGVLSIGFITTSCNDEFSEKDLLELQVQLGTEQDSLNAVRQLAALNAAGDLVSFQVTTVDTDGVGVAGLDVTLGAAGVGGVADNQTLTTDANGAVYFNRVAIGGNNLTITGASIIDALLTLDFGSIQEGTHYQIINGNVLPIPVTENAVLTVIATGTSTATIQGTAIIETDLTNSTPEIPQNLVLRANFDDSLVPQGSININYYFAVNDNALDLGTATVDNTTGAYSMTVPGGVRFDLNVPNFSTTQRIAIGGVNGLLLTRPEYRDVTANFGNNAGTDGIPYINGATVLFDAPVSTGSGFTANNFMRVTRDRNTTVGSAPTTRFDLGNEVIQFTSLGSGYIASPTVTTTDATATNLYAEAHLDMAFTGLTLSSAGTGYPAAVTTYPFNFIYDEVFDNGDGTTGTNTDILWSGGLLDVDTDAAGIFTQAAIDAALATAASNSDYFFDVTALDALGDNATNLRLVNSAATTDAIIAISSAKSRVSNFHFTGDDYTNPTFAFTGGGGTTQAALTMEWGSRWTFSLDNTNTVAYGSLPDVEFEYASVDVNPTVTNTGSLRINDLEGNYDFTDDIVNRLAVSGTGTIIYQNTAENNETNFFSTMAPVTLVENPTGGQSASARADINVDGQITDIWNVFSGNGYTSKFGATIEPSATGAPGAGATIAILGGSTNAQGVYSWGQGRSMTNVGSAYNPQLNMINQGGGTRNYTTTWATNITLNAGDVFIVDIDYGTGERIGNYDDYDGN